jgi:hypothetical protein
MPYEIKERNNKFYVIDTDNNGKIRGTYDSEDAAEDRKDELDFRAHVRSRIDRLPVSEMTAEEKAAAYDKMMAEKNKAPEDKNLPPKKEDPPAPPVQKKRSGYWGEMLDD